MSDTKRNDFEAWYSDQGLFPKSVQRSGDGYVLMQANLSWIAWQAAIASQPERAALPQAEKCGLSWDGKNVYGDAASIQAVKVALHDADTVPYLKNLLSESYKTKSQPSAQSPGIDAVKVEDLDFTPDEHHSISDMANVGYSLMEMIKAYRPSYSWNETPAEIVGDLLLEIEELQEFSAPPPLPSQPEPLGQAMSDGLPEGWSIQQNPNGGMYNLVSPLGSWAIVRNEFRDNNNIIHDFFSALLHKAGASGRDATNSGEIK